METAVIFEGEEGHWEMALWIGGRLIQALSHDTGYLVKKAFSEGARVCSIIIGRAHGTICFEFKDGSIVPTQSSSEMWTVPDKFDTVGGLMDWAVEHEDFGIIHLLE